MGSGTYDIEIQISDQANKPSSWIKIKVLLTNDPPILDSEPNDLEMIQFTTYVYKLPNFADPEGIAISITLLTTLEPFILFDGTSSFTFTPSSYD